MLCYLRKPRLEAFTVIVFTATGIKDDMRKSVKRNKHVNGALNMTSIH